MNRERGFTIAEVLVAAAVMALLAMSAATLAGSRPGTLASATAQIDAAFAQARALAASSGNGATVQFSTSANGGATLTLYSGRPDGVPMTITSARATMPVTVTETSLGAAPFAVFFDEAGDASAMRGSVDTSSTIANDPGCPALGTINVVVSDGGKTATRTLPCASPSP